MTTAARRVTVTTTPTRLDFTPADSDNGMGQVSLLIRCPGTTVYLGGQDVTTGQGLELPAGEWYSEQADESTRPGDALYAVTATGTAAVHVLRRG